MQHVITRRFRYRARIITAAAFAIAVVVLLGGAIAIALADAPHAGILVAFGLTGAAITVMIGVSALVTLYTGYDYFRAGVKHIVDE